MLVLDLNWLMVHLVIKMLVNAADSQPHMLDVHSGRGVRLLDLLLMMMDVLTRLRSRRALLWCAVPNLNARRSHDHQVD